MGFYGLGTESQMIEDALEAGGMAWWLMELPSGIVYCSPNKLKMLGYEERDSNKFMRYTDFTARVHPDDYERCMQAMRDHIEGKSQRYETTYRIKTKKGGYVTLFDRGKIVASKNNEFAVAGIVLNISDYFAEIFDPPVSEAELAKG